MNNSLSSAAQAVWNAFLEKSQWEVTSSELNGVADALIAAADQVVPEQKPWNRTSETGVAKHSVRLKLLAIAAELRRIND